MFQERCQQVREKVQQLVARGNALLKTDLPAPNIRFDLRGRSAGQAYRQFGQYGVRFNCDMMTNAAWDHLIHDTVPHEVAHLFGFHTGRDRAHGPYWKQVCRALGGSGERCHSEEVTYAKGNTFYYTTSTGHVVSVSSIRHRKIQKGVSYRFRDHRGVLNNQCAYSTTKPATATRPSPAAKPPVQPTTAPAPATSVAASGSNADRLRAQLRKLKADLGSEAFERTIDWAVLNLKMSRGLARTYVKNNWNKV